MMISCNFSEVHKPKSMCIFHNAYLISMSVYFLLDKETKVKTFQYFI